MAFKYENYSCKSYILFCYVGKCRGRNILCSRLSYSDYAVDSICAYSFPEQTMIFGNQLADDQRLKLGSTLPVLFVRITVTFPADSITTGHRFFSQWQIII